MSGGWSRGVTSGNTITTFANGARVSRRNHSPRRSFNVSYGTSQSAEDPLWLQVKNDITPSAFGAFDNKPIQQNLVFEAYGLTPNRGFGTMPIGPEFSGRNADMNGDPVPDIGAFSGNTVLIPPVLDRLRLPTDIPNSSRDPNGNPFTNGSWLVSSGSGAEWNNREGQIATWDGNSWAFVTPSVGSLVYVKGQDRYGLCTQTIGGETPQGPIIWLHAWQYSAVEWYQQNKKSWQEILDLFQSVEIDGKPILLAFEGDLVPTESATKGNVLDIHSFWYRGTRVAYDPCTIMMARVKSISSLSQKGYLGGSTQTSNGKECRPMPLLTTSSITFEEDF